MYPPLRRKQRRLVKDNPGVLAAVARGLKLAVDECQYQFRDRRWNCPTSDFLKEKNIFGKIVQIGEEKDRARPGRECVNKGLADKLRGALRVIEFAGREREGSRGDAKPIIS